MWKRGAFQGQGKLRPFAYWLVFIWKLKTKRFRRPSLNLNADKHSSKWTQVQNSFHKLVALKNFKWFRIIWWCSFWGKCFKIFGDLLENKAKGHPFLFLHLSILGLTEQTFCRYCSVCGTLQLQKQCEPNTGFQGSKGIVIEANHCAVHCDQNVISSTPPPPPPQWRGIMHPFFSSSLQEVSFLETVCKTQRAVSINSWIHKDTNNIYDTSHNTCYSKTLGCMVIEGWWATLLSRHHIKIETDYIETSKILAQFRV